MRERQYPSFQGADSYDYMMDLENYIETQSRILTSETLALQTIRITVFRPARNFLRPADLGSNRQRQPGKPETPAELAEFLGSLSVRRVPTAA